MAAITERFDNISERLDQIQEGFDQQREQRRVEKKNADVRRMNQNPDTTEVFKVLCEEEGCPNFGLQPPNDLLPDTVDGLEGLTNAEYDALEEFYGQEFNGNTLFRRWRSLSRFLAIPFQ